VAMWHDLQSCTRQLPSALHHHNAQELACHAVIKGSAHPAAHWLVHPHSEPQTALLRPNTIAAQSGATCRVSVSVQPCCGTASNGAATAAHQDGAACTRSTVVHSLMQTPHSPCWSTLGHKVSHSLRLCPCRTSQALTTRNCWRGLLARGRTTGCHCRPPMRSQWVLLCRR
jgi:hypothetical protein